MRYPILAIATSVLLACAPSETVPGGPNHPADPAANAPASSPPSTSPDTDSGDPPAPQHDHGGHTREQPAASVDPMEAELAAYRAAKPVFDQYCSGCHTSTSKPTKSRANALRHFVMDDYPFGGHHAGELGVTIRKVLGVDGDEPTMPMNDPGAVTGAELDLVVAWSHAFDRAAAAGSGYHGTGSGHDHGKPDHGGHDHGHHNHGD